ncbi:MAG: hypothetical protein GY796_07970 [Chloroflexi bacterium]|nr:hypothetical protein [Chloroflexota bacterium]
MDTTTLLHRMCHDDLSQADINAISKNRGFSRREAANRSTLASFYLSPVGVKKALATLTPAELALLHLLHLAGESASLTWFERLYNPDFKSGYYSRTFTQRYQPVFKQVRTQLVRKGILIMAQKPYPDLTKMEQWRFVFPKEFAPYLPRPMSEIERLTTPGAVQRDVPRNKLLALTGEVDPPLPALPKYAMSLRNGRLLSGDKPFQAADLQKWQKASWQHVMPAGTEYSQRPSVIGPKFMMKPVDALNYALGLLQPDEWILPQQLDDVLKIFCLRTLDTEKICQLGWKWGYLAQNEVNGRTCYRLAGAEPAAAEPPPPADYLSALDEETALLNLRTIPYTVFEQLSQIADLKVTDGKMTAVPNFIRMGVAPQNILVSPLMGWLSDNIPAFAAMQKTIKSRWGKQIVHSNLLVARVKDLPLRIKIERTLKPTEFIPLSDEYIAFPPKALAKVKRIVAQMGHVVKNY